MRPHIVDRPKAASENRMSAFLHIKRQAGLNPAHTLPFRRAGKTIRSVRLRQFLRIERAGLI